MEDIEVSLNKSVLLSNIKKCLTQFGENGTSFMMKAQFLKDKEIRDLFAHYKTYTTSNIWGFLRYDKDCLVADLLEEREGYSKEYFEKRQGSGDWAILNCYCASEKLPTEKELSSAIRFLKDRGYRVSAGGSVIAYYENREYDEIRIGEGVLTGYSTVLMDKFLSCENPFTLKVRIEKEQEHFLLTKHGFLEFGGFTNTQPVFVNTDLSGFNKDTRDGDFIKVNPDYYTLVKLFDRGVDVKYTG